MKEFFAMGGYAFYIWMAYAMAAFLCMAEIVAVRMRIRKARAMAAHRAETSTADHATARLTETKAETKAS
jgi:heme exporter protein CcmD